MSTETFDRKKMGDASLSEALPSSIFTRAIFKAAPARVWDSLLFYEEIEGPPPLLLRLLLPSPIRTEGEKSSVGSEAVCLYDRGHLIKRTTRIEERSLYEFEVLEQKLRLGGSMRLHGGRYALRSEREGETQVVLETRYTSTRWPRWFWRPVERFVCHLFHRFLLRTMQRRAEQA